MDSSMIEPVILATGAVLQSEFGDSARRFHEEGFTVRPVPCDLQIEKGVDAAMAMAVRFTNPRRWVRGVNVLGSL